MTPQQISRKIRYAVVGLGHIAQVAVLPAFENTENSQLVALISNDTKKQKELGRQYGVERVCSYNEYERCLAQGVDAVYIALPNHMHREYTIRAANLGVHILCEKPMAVTEDDCDAMIEAADKSGVKLMIAYRLHFEEGNLEAIQLAQTGVLGEPRIFSSDFTQQVVEGNIRVAYDISRGGGAVYDMGVYCINAARYLFRDEPIEVMGYSASNGEKRFQNVDETSSAILRFPGDRVASFTCSFGAAPTDRYTLVGTKGALVVDPAYEYSTGIKHRLTVEGKTMVREFPHRDQFAAELVYFSNCILKNKEPEPSGLEGLADIRVVRAIHRSAQAGKLIQLPSFSRRVRPSLQQQIHRPAHQHPTPINAASPSGEAA
jgi:glucose-fructose oxidoreductase